MQSASVPHHLPRVHRQGVDPERVRALSEDPVLRERVFLVTRGVPFEAAFALDDQALEANCVAEGGLTAASAPASPPVTFATLGERVAAIGAAHETVAALIGTAEPIFDTLAADYQLRSEAGVDAPEQDATVLAWVEAAEPVLARFVTEYRDLNARLVAAL